MISRLVTTHNIWSVTTCLSDDRGPHNVGMCWIYDITNNEPTNTHNKIGCM